MVKIMGRRGKRERKGERDTQREGYIGERERGGHEERKREREVRRRETERGGSRPNPPRRISMIHHTTICML